MFDLIKEKVQKAWFNSIKTENLYIALIGEIDSKVISDDMYINHGEFPRYYTIVKKDDRYTDIYNNLSHDFRNENEKYTILRMIKLPINDEYVSMDILKEMLFEYNSKLEEEINKRNYNKRFVRTRANTFNRKSV